jgi:hypothetical protein
LNRSLVVLWCSTVLPFATLPWFTIARSQPQPWYFSHALFHIVYMPIVIVAIVAAAWLAANAPQRIVRILAALLAIAQAAAFGGHLGELISVTQHGGWDAGEDIFDETLHSFSSNVTVPALLAGIALVVVITGIVQLQGWRARRDAEVGASPAPPAP